MLRLRRTILTRHFLSPSAPPISSLHRLLSAAAAAAAPTVCPSPSFAVQEYLVETCGLTRPQALKASAKLSHLKSPSNPDAVLSFLAGLGLSGTDAAALVAKDPLFLCAGVDTTLAPNVTELTGLGVSHTEIACLISLTPARFRCRSVISNLPYYMPFFGSTENLVRFFKKSSCLLGSSLEKVVMPNVAFLRRCGLGDCHISKMCLFTPWVVRANPERLQAMVACAQGLGVPRGSGMLRHVLEAIAFLGEENAAAKMDYLKNMFRWSDTEVRIAVCKFPAMLKMSKDNLQSKSEFLISEVGLEPMDIAHQPVMLGLSLEGRLRPRYYVVRFLKENGLVDRDRSYYSSLLAAEKVFLEKYIHPYKETAPCLVEDYAAACRGEVPTTFRFTRTKNGY